MGTKVIKVTLVIHKVNMFSKNIPLKLNYISCHGDKNVILRGVILKRSDSRETKIRSVFLLDLNVRYLFLA